MSIERYLCTAPGGERGVRLTRFLLLYGIIVPIIVNFSTFSFLKCFPHDWQFLECVCLFEVVPLISFSPSMFRGANTLIKTKQIWEM